MLTDESMPDLVGTEFAQQIRRMRPAVAIILMSGHRDTRLESRASRSGVDEVLRKPLRRRDIAMALARLIGSAA